MEYTLKLHRDIEKQLSRISRKQKERLVEVMRSLRFEPRPHDCQYLQDDLYRIRVGEYRIIYAVFDDEIVVVVCKVARRSKKTYKDLEKLLDEALRNLLK